MFSCHRLQMTRRSTAKAATTLRARCTRNLAVASASSPLVAAGERVRAQIDCVRVGSKETRAKGETGQVAASAAAAKAAAGEVKDAEINRIVAALSAFVKHLLQTFEC
jgi:hypothetical protein